MTLSKNKLKYIHSLELKKNRKAEGVFLAEGPKLVGDLLGCFPCPMLIATPEWLRTHASHPALRGTEMTEVTPDELQRASLLKNPQQVLAVFGRSHEERLQPEAFKAILQNGLCLALDDVQDPGNLGTIIRLADWFGIEHIFCSAGTADAFSPKTVQATMGALARVKVHYTDLPGMIASLDGKIPVYGTLLDGENLYAQTLCHNGLIVMGNEGNGISAEVRQLVNRKILIPNYPADRPTSESLNVAIATAIVCAEFRRRE